MTSPMLYVNGKFTAQPTTGVQRVAGEIVRALDQMVTGRHCVLLCPASGRPPPLRRIEYRSVGPFGLPLHAWEQVVLPRAARDGLLLNLAGGAPARAGRQMCMLHDAAVFDHPQAYNSTFVLWYRWLFKHLSRHAERLLTVSAYSQQRLSLHLNRLAKEIAVVTPGADHLERVVANRGALRSYGLHPQKYLLAVASDSPTKNLPALMAALSQLGPRSTLPLVIVGGSNSHIFAGSTAGDPPNVIRTGPLDDERLKALYADAAMLVFPSVYEGFGLPPLEAMACGCPVIVARAASMPEACGTAAAYFDPHSVSDIASVVERVSHDAEERRRLRAAGLVRATSFRWQATAERLLTIIGTPPGCSA